MDGSARLDDDRLGSHHSEPIPARAPERVLSSIEPLITAAVCYPALERAALAAKHSIWFWFRIFDPTMPLVSDEARAAGVTTWAELLHHRAKAGVRVAVAMADFDPIGATALHETAHRNAKALAPLVELGRLDLLVAGHGARAAWFWRFLAWPGVMVRVEMERRRLAVCEDPPARLAHLPGFDRWLCARDRRIVWSGMQLPVLMPATHHQKIAVFDGERAIIGGLDVDRRRFDAPDHDQPAPQTWRDVSAAVDGPVAADIAAHVAACWNHDARRQPENALPRLDPPSSPDAQSVSDMPSVRLSRTVSRGRRPGWASLSARPRVTELEADHVALIRSARRLLYIETQFMRSSRIVRELREAGKARPDLGLIVVLPAAPEDVAFDGSRGLGSRHGEFLQARAVRRLRHVFGDRAVFCSPARPSVREVPDRSTHLKADIVYVHSKVAIADDHTALISSANLNGRSLRWDTEAGVVIRGEEPVRKLREAMFRTLLPDEAPAEAVALPSAVAHWRRIAQGNRQRHPEARRGFLLPYPERDAQNFGYEVPNMPEEMV